MTTILAVTETITTLEEAETRFNLSRTTDPNFFFQNGQRVCLNLPQMKKNL
ncbi:MAG: hypothetical protein WA919_04300 [Coleofasciculaceae cyanobacterium]